MTKINHRLLKRRLLVVLNDIRLSNDWYNIFKSITKYGYYKKDFLIEQFGTDKQLKSNKKTSYFSQLKGFREFQKIHKTKKNKHPYGIPQGTAISAVFANVYATDFDVSMKRIANQYSGVYRRYSDDFILVIPKDQCTHILSLAEFRQIEMNVLRLASLNSIEIQKEKTNSYLYKDKKITTSDGQTLTKIDYLGFVFDGKNVSMRGKSPYKFYRQAYRLIHRAKKVQKRKSLNKAPYRKRIYGLYTDLGTNRGVYGNFINYAKRAQSKFDQLSPNTTNLMMEQIKHRKKKIEKKLGIKIHSIT
ncbi:hypothetical protein [Lysinibacillus boronitolerans]|uniref:hypothetical protein n=1 Tax=Lysinibacillus TaxID=400634 RepID=UPI00289CAC65|nr:hypothetical protein [Lysinibacillus boronitolerans]